MKKTKEVSVALTESSAAEPQTPRKRGRPRKVVEGPQMAQEFQDLEGPDSKKGKTERLEGDEEEKEEAEGKGDEEKRLEEMKREVMVGSSSSSKSIKQEDKGEDNKQQESSSPKKQQQRKSRARKKGKPRKSS